MGLASGWFEETEKILPNLGQKEWFAKHGSSPVLTPPRTRTKTGDGEGAQYKPVEVDIDAAGWLFKTYLVSNSRPCITIRDLAVAHIDKLKLHLGRPEVERVLFRYDLKTPPMKSVTRRPDSGTPETPYHLLSAGFSGSEQQRAAAAWRVRLSRDQDTSDSDGLRTSSRTVNDAGNFKLPPNKTEVSRNGTEAEKRTNYTYEDCLKNSHFKRWIIKELARLILDMIEIPARKSLIIIGPEICAEKTEAGIAEPSDAYLYQYMEMDNSVGYFAAAHAEQYDIDIDSEDGDTVITALLGSHLRMRPGSDVKHCGEAFINGVRLLRNQWVGNRETTIIDINNLYFTLQYAHAALAKTHKVVIENPIGNYALIAFLGGCDYVLPSMLQGVSKTVLLNTYFTYFPVFAQKLASDHIAKPSSVTVDPDSFARLICCCYRNVRGKTKLDLPVDDLVRTCQILHESDTRKADASPYPTVPSVRALLGNVAWTLTYFVSGSVRTALLPDGLTKLYHQPLYGYIRTANDASTHGFSLVEVAEDADAHTMHHKHWQRQQTDPEEWENNKLTELQKDATAE